MTSSRHKQHDDSARQADGGTGHTHKDNPAHATASHRQRPHVARFTSGGITRHLLVMTVMGAIGLMALFLVDFADLWFVSQLGDLQATAALGIAGVVGFFYLSTGLGLGIAAGALVAIHTGAGQVRKARSLAASALLLALLKGAALGLLAIALADAIVQALGAQGRVQALAADYLRIIALGFPLLGGALVFSFTLRGLGLPVRAMLITLTTALTNAALDPLFIFGFGWGLHGAAVATVCGNLAAFVIGALNLHRHYRQLDAGMDHATQSVDAADAPEPAASALPSIPATRLHALFRPHALRADLHEIARMTLPIMLTQLATPVLSGYMLWAAARHGDAAVAAMTVINRLAPVAFGIVFSLSGAVGPIIGQNFGAGLMQRVRRTYEAGLLFATGYTLLGWAVLFLLADAIPGWFGLSGEAAALVRLFCMWLAVAWVFTGGQFVAQAAFNNLRRPHLSTLFNWARALPGTVLPAELLASWGGWGASGILIGAALGWALVGLAAMFTAWRIIIRHSQANAASTASSPAVPMQPPS